MEFSAQRSDILMNEALNMFFLPLSSYISSVDLSKTIYK